MTTWIVEQKNGRVMSLPVRIIEPRQAKAALSPLAWRIMLAISEKPSYPRDLGKRLNVHEQKVYYHIRNLERAGLVRVIKTENVYGMTAKIYDITEPAFALVLRDMEESQKISSLKAEHERFLRPFIENGNLNATIVVGSLDPHGPAKARATDAPYAINLGFFLGSFLNYAPPVSVKLDTEITKDDLKSNLIIVGGPGVNSLTAQINGKLPIRFKEDKKRKYFYTDIFSTVSRKTYAEDENGIIVKMRSPFAADKHVLIVAGKRSQGTKASILAFMHKFDDVCAGNARNPMITAKVVEGIDSDSDGVVDSVEIKE
ncbi:MAG: S-layer protein [Candidatus Aenigmatarchaeota archaeon]